jgi:hypothetical protein
LDDFEFVGRSANSAVFSLFKPVLVGLCGTIGTRQWGTYLFLNIVFFVVGHIFKASKIPVENTVANSEHFRFREPLAF